MRRIYESDAVSREDEDPFKPGKRPDDIKPQAFRSINAAAWSDWFLPHWLRCRAVAVSVTAPERPFERGAEIPFEVTVKNTIPVPVSIKTSSPLLWTWSVDGLEEASHVQLQNPPDHSGRFRLDRGERKEFRKYWSGLFRIAADEWETADPGTYTISAAINAPKAEKFGMADETTVRIQ